MSSSDVFQNVPLNFKTAFIFYNLDKISRNNYTCAGGFAFEYEKIISRLLVAVQRLLVERGQVEGSRVVSVRYRAELRDGLFARAAQRVVQHIL